MKQCLIVAALLLPQFSQQIARADDSEKLERWDRAVCLFTETPGPEGKPSFETCSGFIVTVEETYVLVTTAHSARKTAARTKLFHRKADGESRWIVLAIFNTEQKDPWTYSTKSDRY
jgi:hypothetical protein